MAELIIRRRFDQSRTEPVRPTGAKLASGHLDMKVEEIRDWAYPNKQPVGRTRIGRTLGILRLTSWTDHWPGDGNSPSLADCFVAYWNFAEMMNKMSLKNELMCEVSDMRTLKSKSHWTQIPNNKSANVAKHWISMESDETSWTSSHQINTFIQQAGKIVMSIGY